MSGNEAIHGGADASMFWASDTSPVYTATSWKIWHCGKCGVNLKEGEWTCKYGHRNTP